MERTTAGNGQFGGWVSSEVRRHLDQVRRARRQVLRRGDPGDVHRLRTGLRRLETALWLAGLTMRLGEGTQLGSLRPVIRATGRLRDHDVERRLLAGLAVAVGPERDAVDGLVAGMERARGELLARARMALRSEPTRRALLNARRGTRRPAWLPLAYRDLEGAREALWADAVNRLRRHPGWQLRWQEARSSERTLHGLRLAAKNVKQTGELLAIDPDRTKEAAGTTEVLGDLRDWRRVLQRLPARLAVARDEVRQRQAELAARWNGLRQQLAERSPC